ncbi:MAG: tRNA1(Val) (adenine(37)-N6)-methyltransferase [Clostridia bacterium]|nr:tRNA1(Val) (adenine(37)-N6)-methyltransferase [Clostridia bacterium]
MDIELERNERIDDLQLKGLKIIQNKDFFCFGMDAVLLSAYAYVRRDDLVADLGTGTGIIPLLLSGRTQAARIVGVEIQQQVAQMAKRSVKLNDIDDRIEIINYDIKKIQDVLEKASFDAVVSNPPYKPVGRGKINPNKAKAISKHEIECTIQDTIKAADYLLKPGGRFYIVYRPDRMVDALYCMRNMRIEPKRMKMVHSFVSKPPKLVLIEGVKHSKPDFKLECPLYIYKDDGEYTEDIINIYQKGEQL